MDKTFEQNNAQETTLVPTNNTIAPTTQNAASLSPIDDSRPAIETSFVDAKEQAPEKEQTPAADSSSEKKEEKTKKHRKTNHCREDHDNKQLIVTKETSKPGTAAFNELMEKRKLYPDYKIVYRTVKSSDNRLSVRNLTAKDMEKFIKLTYNNDKKRMTEFNLQSQLSELYPAPITYLRNWFRRNYREYWENAKKAANA